MTERFIIIDDGVLETVIYDRRKKLAIRVDHEATDNLDYIERLIASLDKKK